MLQAQPLRLVQFYNSPVTSHARARILPSRQEASCPHRAGSRRFSTGPRSFLPSGRLSIYNNKLYKYIPCISLRKITVAETFVAIRCMASVRGAVGGLRACTITGFHCTHSFVQAARATYPETRRCFSRGQARTHAFIRSCETIAELPNRIAAGHADIA